VGTLKGDLSQFRELESFAAFGSELDKVSQAQLDRGYRLVELLKQPLNSPMPVEEQVVSLYAGTQGYLDQAPVSEVRRFESELLEWFRARHRDILEAIRSTGDIPDEEAFEAALSAFAEQFSWEQAADEATAAQPEDEAAPAVDPATGSAVTGGIAPAEADAVPTEAQV
jgi:F-type H+/Na+-transporting ATPase subunit alpha